MGQLVRPDKVTTFRCSAHLGDQLEAVARVDDMSASEVLREALTRYVADRRADPGFRAALAALIARDQAMLATLEDPISSPGETS